MRHIETICDSDSYLIYHHGSLQVNTSTVLQHLAFNLASVSVDLESQYMHAPMKGQSQHDDHMPQSECWNSTDKGSVQQRVD